VCERVCACAHVCECEHVCVRECICVHACMSMCVRVPNPPYPPSFLLWAPHALRTTHTPNILWCCHCDRRTRLVRADMEPPPEACLPIPSLFPPFLPPLSPSSFSSLHTLPLPPLPYRPYFTYPTNLLTNSPTHCPAEPGTTRTQSTIQTAHTEQGDE